MELHHKKHHQTYVNTFNTLAEQFSDAEAKNDVAKMIALQGGIKFNGGGKCSACKLKFVSLACRRDMRDDRCSVVNPAVTCVWW